MDEIIGKYIRKRIRIDFENKDVYILDLKSHHQFEVDVADIFDLKGFNIRWWIVDNLIPERLDWHLKTKWKNMSQSRPLWIDGFMGERIEP